MTPLQHFSAKRTLIWLTSMSIAIALALFSADSTIHRCGQHRLYSEIKQLPHRHCGLLLGASQQTGDHENPYFRNRVNAVAELFKQRCINALIVSGDNSRSDYDEPSAMRTELIRLGVDSTKIVCDYAGFRTFDSIIRAREIFSQDSLLIISQQFHNERALYIAQRSGIDAIAFNATEVGNGYAIRTQIREKFARLRTILDFYIGTTPHFLGPKVEVPS